MSQKDKILNEKIFEDCEIVVKKFDRNFFCDKGFKATITSKISELPHYIAEPFHAEFVS